MEFKRFVSYIYEYRSNEKQQNCGFVKVEVRQDMVKLIVHMYMPGKKETACKVYGFVREKDALEGVMLGSGRVKNGNLDVRIHMHALQLGKGVIEGQEPVAVEELSGLLVSGSDGSVYGTVWDEEELDVSKFRERAVKKVEETDGDDSENVDAQLQAQECPIQEGVSYVNRMSAIPDWETLQRNCPVISPFEVPREGIYLRIEPKHLKYFARKLWYLGNNSFLLHGYYNYRYLIVGKEKEGIVLGIPGIYYPREENIAAMFGFPAFLPGKKNSRDIGRFGYWCRRM